MEEIGIIHVTCPPWRANRRMRFELRLDGAERGVLRAGKSLALQVPTGRHTMEVELRRRRMGTFDMEIDVQADEEITIVCAANLAGLRAAFRSQITENWDGPPPFSLRLLEDGQDPKEDSQRNWEWWADGILSQEAFADSPLLWQRVFYRIAIKHYVMFGMVSAILFGFLLITTLTSAPASLFFAAFWSVLVAMVIVTMSARAWAHWKVRSRGGSS